MNYLRPRALPPIRREVMPHHRLRRRHASPLCQASWGEETAATGGLRMSSVLTA
ncbi:hypothetical protein DPMN_033121 [Dreissena polymorpha]|uniref:Uncharacterized protein n=1 Tax=Dreissena polymorpha TaxID=45954 RepID=A0A9D4M5C3_DREPO|nr:hypothetical protein DPMN_033121 [Dreissena polymorpha]